MGQWDVVPSPPQHGGRNQRGRNQRRPSSDELPGTHTTPTPEHSPSLLDEKTEAKAFPLLP